MEQTTYTEGLIIEAFNNLATLRFLISVNAVNLDCIRNAKL